MKRWRYALLLLELFLFALILVLPQVNLPDFTFPGGTAPVVAKAKLSSRPALPTVLAPVHVRSFEHIAATISPGIQAVLPVTPLSPVTLCCILRC